MTKPTIKKKGKSTLSDRRLIELALENEAEQNRIDKLQSKLNANKVKVITELEARGTASLDNGGWRVTGVWSESTTYDKEGLRAELTNEQRKRVEIKVVDMKLVSQEVQAGRLDAKVVKKYTTVAPKKAYYRLSSTEKEK